MRIILSGGGTGGHVYPAIAIANRIKEKNPDAEILFVGTKKGIESSIVPKYGYPIEYIEVKGFKRKIDFENVKRVFMFLKSLRDSKRIIKKFKPDLVIGTGGYVSGSIVLKASQMNIKTCIHEQNSFPGITNKMLSKNVDLVLTSFEDSHKRFPEKASSKLYLTGNPVRDEILNADKKTCRELLNIPMDKKMLLVSGGSGGSEEINDSLEIALPKLVEMDYAFTIATGRLYYEAFMKKYSKLEYKPYQRVVEYLDQMPENLASADLCIGSAGAISMAEMTAVGKASIIVPKAYTAENHQEYNAKSLEKMGASICITEKELTPESMDKAIFSLLEDDERLKQMSEKSFEFGKRDAIDRIYSLIESNFLCKIKKNN